MASNQSDGQSGGGGSEALQWMYRDPRSSGPSAEDYLLGLKYKDDQKNDEVKELEHNRGDLPGSTFLRDQRKNEEAAVRNEAIAIKREDPLFSMRDKEKQARGEVLNNPLKIKRMKQFFIEKAKDMKGSKSSRSSSKSKDKDKKSRHKHKRRKKTKHRSSSRSPVGGESRRHRRSKEKTNEEGDSASSSEDDSSSEARRSRGSRSSRRRSPAAKSRRDSRERSRNRRRSGSVDRRDRQRRRSRHHRSSPSSQERKQSPRRYERGKRQRSPESETPDSHSYESNSSKMVSGRPRSTSGNGEATGSGHASRQSAKQTDDHPTESSDYDKCVTERAEQVSDLDTEERSKKYGLIQPKKNSEQHDATSSEAKRTKQLGPSADMIESRMKVMRQEQRKQLRLDSTTSEGGNSRRPNLSQEERLKKLSEMSATAHQLSQERQYKTARAEREEEQERPASSSKNFLSEFHQEVASRGDVGSRVQGRRHYIQRDASASNFMSR